MKKSKKDLIIKELEKTPIVSVVCKKVGVSRNTYYRWLRTDKEFLRRVDEAQYMGISIVSDAAESNVIQGIRNKDPAMTRYWLGHRHPAYRKPFVYRDDLRDPLIKEQQAKIKEIQNTLKRLDSGRSSEDRERAKQKAQEFMAKWFPKDKKDTK